MLQSNFKLEFSDTDLTVKSDLAFDLELTMSLMDSLKVNGYIL